MKTPAYLGQALERRLKAGSLRQLKAQARGVDFYSNDYLGLSRSGELAARIERQISAIPDLPLGATGSRLLSGNHWLFEELEMLLSEFHQADTALIFNSGYLANLGLITALATRHDLVLYDERVHASIRDALQLSRAQSFSFRHNDLENLKARLQKIRKKNTYIIVESVYSMDGDYAPLVELAELAESFDAYLIVDEAHATGLYGLHGEGRVVECGLAERVFARVHTFGKALGLHGAAVVGPQILKDYLINFSRPFIYTTALPPHDLIAVKEAYVYLRESGKERRALQALISCYRECLQSFKSGYALDSPSAIQGFVVPGNAECRGLAAAMQEEGFLVLPVLHPTVARGNERVRICLHSFNTEAECQRLIDVARIYGEAL